MVRSFPSGPWKAMRPISRSDRRSGAGGTGVWAIGAVGRIWRTWLKPQRLKGGWRQFARVTCSAGAGGNPRIKGSVLTMTPPVKAQTKDREPLDIADRRAPEASSDGGKFHHAGMRLGRRAAAKAALLSRRNFGAQWKHMSQSESIGVVDGRETRAFTITNGKGLTARIMELGATLLEFHAPDRRGQLADIALGEQGLAAYLVSHSYFGAICGRYGNRIGRGRLILDGKAHQLSCNEGRNHLHGGFRGFDKHLWSGRPAADGRSVAFSYRSADGEEGFPGNLDAAV